VVSTGHSHRGQCLKKGKLTFGEQKSDLGPVESASHQATDEDDRVLLSANERQPSSLGLASRGT
jgi:hypothetical protein